MERARAARVLGVDTTATPEQVRDAFRRRAHEVHPDKVGGDAASMAELNAAYEALSVRTGDGWEFVGSPAVSRPVPPPPFDDATSFDHATPFDDDLDSQSGAGWSLLRAFPIVVGIVGTVLTAIVFVVAIGYDWSLSP